MRKDWSFEESGQYSTLAPHVHLIMSTISTYTGIQRMSPLQET